MVLPHFRKLLAEFEILTVDNKGLIVPASVLDLLCKSSVVRTVHVFNMDVAYAPICTAVFDEGTFEKTSDLARVRTRYQVEDDHAMVVADFQGSRYPFADYIVFVFLFAQRSSMLDPLYSRSHLVPVAD